MAFDTDLISGYGKELARSSCPTESPYIIQVVALSNSIVCQFATLKLLIMSYNMSAEGLETGSILQQCTTTSR